MSAIDAAIMDCAKPYLFDAMATFGKRGDDPFEVARGVADAAKMAGFSKRGRRLLLEYLYVLVDDLLLNGTDPLTQGHTVAKAISLFEPDRLGGLFNIVPVTTTDEQGELFDGQGGEEKERALIEQLIAATHLYDSSDAVKELIDFTIRLRAFAPFNAMLLHIQKPGLTYATTASDWYQRFERVPRREARPLLILRTMGPVDFVFDILDTVGPPVPEHAFAFPTLGSLSEERFAEIAGMVGRDRVSLLRLDRGDSQAGWIKRAGTDAKDRAWYELAYNVNHPPATRLVTIAHELAHLHLGHLGADKTWNIRDNRDRTHEQREVEAEIAAYLVAKRNGLTPRSESYVSTYKGAISSIDLYAVMRVANAVERAMGLSARQLASQAVAGATG